MPHTKQTVERRIKQAQDNCQASPENLKLISNFIECCYAEGLGHNRVYKYLTEALKICQKLPELGINKTLDKLDKEDIKKYCSWLEQNDLYTANTKQNYKVTLKKFFKVLNGGEDYPENVKHIRTGLKAANKKLPSDMLSETEMDAIVKVAAHPRNKALLSLMCESGARLGEIANLKLKNIEFDNNGAKVRLEGKTGVRVVRVVRCVPFLASWTNLHPKAQNGESPMWIKNSGKPLNYQSIPKVLKEHAKKAGIQKKIYPHLLRHSRATLWANKLTEARMKQIFGWTQSSKMAGVYVHLSARDADDAVLGLYGIKQEKQEAPVLPVNCSRCGTPNENGAKFCNKCGLPQNIKTAIEAEERMRADDEFLFKFLQRPEVLNLLKQAMKENKTPAT